MNKIALFTIFFNLLLLIGVSSASYYFEILNISEVKLAPDSDTNFTVSVKGLGSQGGYVDLVYRNLSTNLTVVKDRKMKYVFPAGIAKFEHTMKAGNVEPGNYSFEVGISAKGSPPNWRTVHAIVEPEGAETCETPQIEKPMVNETMLPIKNQTPEKASKSTPGPGLLASIAALVLISRRFKSWPY
jgi:hypothetical protein